MKKPPGKQLLFQAVSHYIVLWFNRPSGRTPVTWAAVDAAILLCLPLITMLLLHDMDGMPLCLVSVMLQTLELGASIIHAQNQYVLSLAKQMELTPIKGDDTGNVFNIYDGNSFVFKQVGMARPQTAASFVLKQVKMQYAAVLVLCHYFPSTSKSS